ncbi:DNA/RNA non-specific endonuclease [Lacrimispora indolis]|uniref:DNA/RNA non-specific endonuclease n=1 Tax=Lacrimispora indolis TaxID=69825 RepID=UPI00041F9B4B|nr:DNA/RNA non-specific endonuclease [[Clostridium] methoxybenzovorans]
MFKSIIFKKKAGFIIGTLAIMAAAISYNGNSYADNNIAVTINNESIVYNGATYKIIQVDGGDLSGNRQSNVAVDIGYGDRTYWAFTNEHGQLVYVTADKITIQDDSTEPVNSNGRYYPDEAKVPGTEQEDLDEGHVIADSLGGVSNAYNITPQNSTLNRHGDQAYMEKVIRDAGGCENFVATITYPDTNTQIPSHYHYEYVLNGNKVVDDFDNVNPDEVNAAINNQTDTAEATTTPVTEAATTNEQEELTNIDTNGNGKVTIAEAEAAGYSMPIYSDHWLYKYMDDRDGDGMVGE